MKAKANGLQVMRAGKSPSSGLAGKKLTED